MLKKFKKILETDIKNKFNLTVTVGKHHTGWSKTSAIQFHKHEGRNDYALQLEISSIFRKNKENMQYIIDLISKSLQEVFINK